MSTKGFCGYLLRVNLTTRECTKTPLPGEDTLRKYLGGIGLGIKIIMDEVAPSVKAADPEAPLMFMAGPLAGTSAPSSSNLAVVSLNYNTPYAVATGHSHGYWAAYLRHAGYDGVVITGQADKPVYLWIDDDHVEIRDATKFWGQDTRETERLIKLELCDEEKISVACIGPAGEAMLHGASIKNDRNHGASKGSVGAVMGSKRLKALAVRGTGSVALAEPALFSDVTQQWQDDVMKEPPKGKASSVGRLMSNGGITRAYSFLGGADMLATMNLTEPTWGREFANELSKWVQDGDLTITPRESYNCNIACAYDCEINKGEYAGFTASMCGGGENIEGAAGLIGVEDPALALILTDYMDGIGIDSSVGGALMGMSYELYNRGILTKEHTGGLDLTWGNFDSAMTLLNQMCTGEGFGGTVLAKGLKEAALILGPEAQGCVLHIRGGGFNMHDWRTAWSILLGQIVSGAGACWQGPGVDFFAPEPDLGYTEFSAPFETAGKAKAVAKTQAKKLWEDTLGVCWFACWGVKGVLDYASRSIALATGWADFDAEEAMLLGERVINLQRLIAVSRGFKPEDEFDVSERLLEAPTSGAATGKSIKPYLKDMVYEYYELMGWDKNTAQPTTETLARVGLL